MRYRIAFGGVAASAALALTGLGAATPPAYASNLTSVHESNATSPGQAGYELSPAPTTASAAGTFKVPTLTCTSTLAGIAPGSFVFTTTSVSGSGVVALCNGGAPLYQADLIINGTGFALAVAISAGDVITTSAAESATKTTVAFKDVTKHFTKTMTGTGGTVSSVLEGIDSLTNGHTLPVPKFTPIAFSAGLIDGKTLNASGAKALDLVIHPPTLNIKTGTLDTTGKKFTETFKHS